MRCKNVKTTAVGIILIASTIVALVMVLIDKATLGDAGSFMAIVIGLMSAIGFINAKDADKTS